MNTRQIAKLAKDMGLIVGRGTYNGAKFWTRPGSNAIITANDVIERAYHWRIIERAEA